LHEALQQRSITFFSREIHSTIFGRSEKISSQIPAMTPRLFQNKRRMENSMIKKLLGAAAMAAVAFVVVPAHAAGGCSSANLTKTESMVEAMADSDGKVMAQKEVAAAQEAMLAGKMGACGMHLNKAMHAGMAH
jgi:hypothetical protein